MNAFALGLSNTEHVNESLVSLVFALDKFVSVDIEIFQISAL